jgi:hypothetical protein
MYFDLVRARFLSLLSMGMNSFCPRMNLRPFLRAKRRYLLNLTRANTSEDSWLIC